MRKEKFIAAGFGLMLAAGMAAHIILPDQDISRSERRNLNQMPEFTASSVLSGEYFTSLEDYLLDQFPARDFFRFSAGMMKQNIFGRKDVDGIYQIADAVYKLEYPLSESAVLRAANGFSDFCREYFPDSNCYYAIIPDKNYFVAEENGYPSLDYGKLENLMQEGMTEAAYLRIFDLLELSDYYRLDLHWKQECIVDVAERLLAGMDKGYKPQTEYEPYLSDDEFYGSYYFQAAAPYLAPDKITCLGFEGMEDIEVYDYEKNRNLPIYAEERLEGMDAYDVYLSGAKALLELKNPNAKQKKTLYLFRDSFGSSIAPLLIENYSRIVMIDLRYVTGDAFMKLMGGEIDADSDVLFLYNTMILNQSMMLRL